MIIDCGRIQSSSSFSSSNYRSGDGTFCDHQINHYLQIMNSDQFPVQQQSSSGFSGSRGGGNSPSGEREPIGRCGVCGDKAFFHNFNALTCQACKGI